MMGQNRNNQRGGAPAGPRHGGPMGGGMMVRGEKARDFKGTMRKLIAYLSPHKVAITIVLIFAIASTLFSIVGPKILGQATTKLFEGVIAQISGTGGGIDFGYIGNIILILGRAVSDLGIVQLHSRLGDGGRLDARSPIACVRTSPRRSTGCPCATSTARIRVKCSRASPTTWTRSARRSTRV